MSDLDNILDLGCFGKVGQWRHQYQYKCLFFVPVYVVGEMKIKTSKFYPEIEPLWCTTVETWFSRHTKYGKTLDLNTWLMYWRAMLPHTIMFGLPCVCVRASFQHKMVILIYFGSTRSVLIILNLLWPKNKFQIKMEPFENEFNVVWRRQASNKHYDWATL